MLRVIVCEKVEEELDLDETEIVYKGFTLGGIAVTNHTIMSLGGVFIDR